jgi:hypothetical protein
MVANVDGGQCWWWWLVVAAAEAVLEMATTQYRN